MELDTILDELEQLTAEQYGYLGVAAIFGPLLLKLLGFKLLGATRSPACTGADSRWHLCPSTAWVRTNVERRHQRKSPAEPIGSAGLFASSEREISRQRPCLPERIPLPSIARTHPTG